MKRNTSYPAIALLVSVFILITAFALLVAGHNNYLEKQREVGKEIIEEFSKYNILQYYLYVLSDYEVRKAFFNAVYDVFANSTDKNGYLDISKLNKGILGWSDDCKNLTNYTIKDNVLVIYPCIKPIPLFDFQNKLNKTFTGSIINNFKPEEHLGNISSFYGVYIKQYKKDYFIGYDYFNLYQEVNYSYTSETYSRWLNIGVNYSVIPSIIIYNQLLAKTYMDYYSKYIKLLKNLYGSYIYKGVNDTFDILKIGYSKNIDGYTLLFGKNPGETDEIDLTEFENFLRIYILDREMNKKSFKVMQEFPIFCQIFGQYELSSGNVSYIEKNGCKIATLVNVPHTYTYFIEECLLSSSYREFTLLEDIISSIVDPNTEIKYIEYANLTFYNISFITDVFSLIFQPSLVSGLPTYLDIDGKSPLDVKISYGNDLWPTNGYYNGLTLVKIGEFVPIRCTVGEKVYTKTFDNEAECSNEYNNLYNNIGRGRDPFKEIRKACECNRWEKICRKKDCDEEGNCIIICEDICVEYLLEWIERVKSISVATDMNNISLAIYWPYNQMESLLNHLKSS